MIKPRAIRPEGATLWKIEAYVHDTTGRTATQIEDELWDLLETSDHLVPEDVSVEEHGEP